MANPCFIKYKGKEYTYEEFVELLHSGELDALIKSGELDVSKLKGEIPKAQISTDIIDSFYADIKEISAKNVIFDMIKAGKIKRKC